MCHTAGERLLEGGLMQGGVFSARGKEGERGTSRKMKQNNSNVLQSDLLKPSMPFVIF